MEELLYFYIIFTYLVQLGVISIDSNLGNLINLAIAPITFPVILGRYLANTFNS